MTVLRRLLNRIDRRLDGTTLAAPAVTAECLPGGGVPCLASHALERAFPIAQRLDEDPRLKRVTAPQGTAADGAARRWTFFFELPTARAKLMCDWYLDGDTSAGRFGRECLDSRATPFPPPDSELARGVAAGALSYALLATAWREERRRLADLPLVFRDSDAALADLQGQGLRPATMAFTLRSEIQPGQTPAWVAQTDGQLFRCRFGADRPR